MIDTLFEQAINKVLALDKNIDLSKVNKKVILLIIEDVPIKKIEITMLFLDRHIHLLNSYNSGFDVSLGISLKTFKELSEKTDIQQLIREDKIKIHGDVRTATLILDTLKKISIKYSLNKFIDDILNKSKPFRYKAKDIVRHILR